MASVDPRSEVPPYVDWLRGVPRQYRAVVDLIPHVKVCFMPEDFMDILRKALIGERAEISPDGWRKEEINLTPFTRPMVVKVDPATEYWLRQLSRSYGLSISSAIRLGVFLLKEFLERGKVEG